MSNLYYFVWMCPAWVLQILVSPAVKVQTASAFILILSPFQKQFWWKISPSVSSLSTSSFMWINVIKFYWGICYLKGDQSWLDTEPVIIANFQYNLWWGAKFCWLKERNISKTLLVRVGEMGIIFHVLGPFSSIVLLIIVTETFRK